MFQICHSISINAVPLFIYYYCYKILIKPHAKSIKQINKKVKSCLHNLPPKGKKKVTINKVNAYNSNEP